MEYNCILRVYSGYGPTTDQWEGITKVWKVDSKHVYRVDWNLRLLECRKCRSKVECRMSYVDYAVARYLTFLWLTRINAICLIHKYINTYINTIVIVIVIMVYRFVYRGVYREYTSRADLFLSILNAAKKHNF